MLQVMGQERRKFKENNTAISTIKALEQNALKDNKKAFTISLQIASLD